MYLFFLLLFAVLVSEELISDMLSICFGPLLSHAQEMKLSTMQVADCHRSGHTNAEADCPLGSKSLFHSRNSGTCLRKRLEAIHIQLIKNQNMNWTWRLRLFGPVLRRLRQGNSHDFEIQARNAWVLASLKQPLPQCTHHSHELVLGFTEGTSLPWPTASSPWGLLYLPSLALPPS